MRTCVCVRACVRVCVCVCVCVCMCVCVGGGVVFPYGALCGLFWWDCALRVYRISQLG